MLGEIHCASLLYASARAELLSELRGGFRIQKEVRGTILILQSPSGLHLHTWPIPARCLTMFSKRCLHPIFIPDLQTVSAV